MLTTTQTLAAVQFITLVPLFIAGVYYFARLIIKTTLNSKEYE